METDRRVLLRGITGAAVLAPWLDLQRAMTRWTAMPLSLVSVGSTT